MREENGGDVEGQEDSELCRALRSGKERDLLLFPVATVTSSVTYVTFRPCDDTVTYLYSFTLLRAVPDPQPYRRELHDGDGRLSNIITKLP